MEGDPLLQGAVLAASGHSVGPGRAGSLPWQQPRCTTGDGDGLGDPLGSTTTGLEGPTFTEAEDADPYIPEGVSTLGI